VTTTHDDATQFRRQVHHLAAQILAQRAQEDRLKETYQKAVQARKRLQVRLEQAIAEDLQPAPLYDGVDALAPAPAPKNRKRREPLSEPPRVDPVTRATYLASLLRYEDREQALPVLQAAGLITIGDLLDRAASVDRLVREGVAYRSDTQAVYTVLRSLRPALPPAVVTALSDAVVDAGLVGYPDAQEPAAATGGDDWIASVRDPATRATEGERTVRTGSASAVYQIAPLPDGRWALRFDLEVWKGTHSGHGSPWVAHASRQACLDAFLAAARDFFRAGNSRWQNSPGGAKAAAGLWKLIDPARPFAEPPAFPPDTWADDLDEAAGEPPLNGACPPTPARAARDAGVPAAGAYMPGVGDVLRVGDRVRKLGLDDDRQGVVTALHPPDRRHADSTVTVLWDQHPGEKRRGRGRLRPGDLAAVEQDRAAAGEDLAATAALPVPPLRVPAGQVPDGQPVGRCRVCGCTAADCRLCVERTGSPCGWMTTAQDLCSACEAIWMTTLHGLPGLPAGVAGKLSRAKCWTVGDVPFWLDDGTAVVRLSRKPLALTVAQATQLLAAVRGLVQQQLTLTDDGSPLMPPDGDTGPAAGETRTP
jgi:hypothetical protein